MFDFLRGNMAIKAASNAQYRSKITNCLTGCRLGCERVDDLETSLPALSHHAKAFKRFDPSQRAVDMIK
jgi:hypothetical protein